MSGHPVILMLAGEASGDLHGAHVARALRKRWPDVTLRGLGGDGMASEGVELFARLDQLAVMGFVEVLKHLPFFRKLEKRLSQLLDGGPFFRENINDFGKGITAIIADHRQLTDPVGSGQGSSLNIRQGFNRIHRFSGDNSIHTNYSISF